MVSQSSRAFGRVSIHAPLHREERLSYRATVGNADAHGFNPRPSP